MRVEADRVLIQRFEPVMRYTRGERFFPMDVQAYLRESSLWVQRPGEEAELLIPEGELTAERLIEPFAHGSDAVYFLKFIDSLDIRELAAYRLQELRGPRQERFRAGRGRLARVGYTSRVVDAFFSLTLLARGRVPGDTAGAAALAYEQAMAEDEGYVYYARLVRQSGWLALQYWFFYPFNNWRSGFSGVNDHEADWEMICIYLWEDDRGLQPEWIAYASHDSSGDDLRRHWDDPEVESVGEHPIVHVGAGSHASYFAAGEYLAELEIPFPAPLNALANRLQDLWSKLVKRDQNRGRSSEDRFQVLRVPFVDYARGDGVSIGPGQANAWSEPQLLDPIPDWALGYRGLWGLYARDPISGEDAPAGLLYNRDGTLRRSWYDPVGWAGLDKVPTPRETSALLEERQVQVEARRTALQETIKQKSQELVALGVEAESVRGYPHLKGLYATRQADIVRLSEEVNELRAQVAEDEALREALALQTAKVEASERGPLRAHIRRAHHPVSDAEVQFGRWAEAWASISIGLMLVGVVILILFARRYLALGLVGLLGLIIFIEAGFRRQLRQFITSTTIALAAFATLIIIYQFFWQIIMLAILLAGVYVMVENLRELRG